MIAGAAARNAPPRRIPPEMLDGYTMGGRVRIIDSYRDDSVAPDAPTRYTREQFDAWMHDAEQRLSKFYDKTDEYLYTALDAHPIGGAHVAVFGSTRPWYESIALARGAARITIIDYNPPVVEHPSVDTMHPSELAARSAKFDAAFSISSFEHDGLGRYGDPLNPDADIDAMRTVARALRPGSPLFLAVPVGIDTVVWNRHRVYGRHRLPLLLNGWERVGAFGFTEQDLELDRWSPVHQPILALRSQ